MTTPSSSSRSISSSTASPSSTAADRFRAGSAVACSQAGILRDIRWRPHRREGADRDFDTRFECGLDRIIAGIAATLPAKP
jgi:hypothetical protein